MKKFFLLFTILSLSLPTTVRAASILDFIYPPIQMQKSSRSAPGEAIAPEVPSNDTYSNTLKSNITKCESTVTLSKTWTPIKQQTGVDQDGNPIIEDVPQDAKDLKSEINIKDLSNDGLRNFHTFLARGEIKCSGDKIETAYTDLTNQGDGAALRMTPYKTILYNRSLLLEQAAESLDRQNQKDTVAQDVQIAWSCQGACKELSASVDRSSCRPVTLSEVLFGLKDEDIYLSDPNTTASRFPDFIVTNLASYFSGDCSSPYSCYQNRFSGKTFSPLSKKIYQLMYQQLNFIPKGNVNNEITVTRYDGYDMTAKMAINPVPTVFNRNLPNGAALASDQAEVLSYVNPSSQEDLPGTNLCNNVKTTSIPAIDKPPSSVISLFINGLFKHLDAGETYTQSGTNQVKSVYDSKMVDNSATAEKAFSNLIPAQTLKDKALLEESFSSTTQDNQAYSIPDPFNRGNQLYLTFTKMLRPASWQRGPQL